MNIETIGIQQGTTPAQAQNAKDLAADPLAALFAELLGLSDPMSPGGDSPKSDTESSTELSKAQPMISPGAPFLPLPVAIAHGIGDAASPARAIGASEAAKAGAAPIKADAAATVAATAAAAAQPEAKSPGAMPLVKTEPAAGAPANAAPAGAETTPGQQPVARADSSAAAATAASPLAIKLAPKVTLPAPQTTPPVGAEKAKPAASARAERPTTPVSVAFEKAPGRAVAAASDAAPPDGAAPAPAEAKDPPASASAAPESRGLSAQALAAHQPAPLGDQRPAQLAAAGAPLHTATQQVVHRLEKAIEHSEDRIRIELEPASLGGVEVQLRIADDGRVSAIVRADRSDTLALLQNDARGLEQALRDAGLRPEAGSLSFNLRQGEGQAGNQPDARGQRRRSGAERTVFAIDGAGPAAPAQRHLLGGLDIRI